MMYGMNYPLNQPLYQAPIDERIWVQNEASAEAYLVAPNGFVRLWDSQRPVFYEKRADATGRPMPMEIFEYTKKEHVDQAQALEDYQTEIDKIIKRIEKLEQERNYDKQSDADDTAIQSV